MGCFSGDIKGQSVQQVEKLTPEQQRLIGLLTKQAGPAISGVGGATVPGMEFAPGGPSELQQQAFGMAGQLPGMFEGGIQEMMQPVGDFARQGFQQETIPAIMSALGAGGMARSSGAANILGRQGRNLELGLASQFAPMQLQAQQMQMGLPGMMAGLGAQQRGIGEEQTQFGLQRFMQGTPEQDPRLGFIGPAFTSAYDTAVQQGFYEPSMWSQALSAAGGVGGGYAASGGFG